MLWTWLRFSKKGNFLLFNCHSWLYSDYGDGAILWKPELWFVNWDLGYINWGYFNISFNSQVAPTKTVIQPSSSRKKLKSKHYKFLLEAYYLFFHDWEHHASKFSIKLHNKFRSFNSTTNFNKTWHGAISLDSRSLGERDQNLGLR